MAATLHQELGILASYQALQDVGQVTEPPNPSPYGPPPGYPQQPNYPPQPSYGQQPSYPPQPNYGQQPTYPPPGYSGYQPPGYPPSGYPTPAPRPPAPRRLLWSWISCLGLTVAAGIAVVAFAVVWVQSAGRLGIPANTSATYGTVISAESGGQLRVAVHAGAPLIRRTVTHTFNSTNTNTSTTHFGEGFTAVVVGAPALAPGVEVSFYFSDSDNHGTYLPVAPSRIRTAAKIPAGLIAAFVVGLIFGLVGVVLLIVWLVSLRRRRQPAVPMYAPPAMYWPPSTPPR